MSRRGVEEEILKVGRENGGRHCYNVQPRSQDPRARSTVLLYVEKKEGETLTRLTVIRALLKEVEVPIT